MFSTTSTPITTLDLLGQLAKPKATPAKSSAPNLVMPELADKLAEYKNIKAALKDAQARKDLIEADLIAAVEPRRCELSRTKGESIGSLKVNGSSYVTYSNSQKCLTEDEAVHAQSVLGSLAAKYLIPTYQISVDLTKLAPEIIAALNAAGANITVTHKIAKQLHDDRTMDPNVQALADQCPELKPIRYFR